MPQIALGTVQFGLNYGISNTQGKVSSDEVSRILDYAEECFIPMLDTAAAYGSSEIVLGEILNKKRLNPFRIVTKVPPCKRHEIEDHFHQSLKNLRHDSIDGVLFHSYQALSDDFSKWDILAQLKENGKVRKIGTSLYHPAEWLELKERNIIPDIIQIPFSIFDRRFMPYLGEMKKYNIEIHVRSVFLQGLFFMKPEALPAFFLPIKNDLQKLRKVSNDLSLSISALCLQFVKTFEEIDFVVLGVETKDQLKENIEQFYANEETLLTVRNELLKINICNERMVLPYLWPKKL